MRKEEKQKNKGENERCVQLNVEFQRIARKDKKALLNEQFKEMEETIEWERLEISSRKLDISREYFHAGMDTIKDRKCKDLTEAEEIKKRWQEYRELLSMV